jgi:dolichyl-diphosphooligosaccharide--protein glycosyltransferase
MRTWRIVHADSGTWLFPGDAYYHARLADLTRHRFPRPVQFDRFVGYPGIQVPYPPGHSWLLMLFDPLGRGVPVNFGTLAWSGPLLSFAGCVILIGLIWRWYGRDAACAASAVLMTVPGAVMPGYLGEADHHVHEVFFAALVPLLAFRELETPLLRWRGLASGLAAGMAHLFFLSAWTVLPLTTLALVAAAVASPSRRIEILRLLVTVTISAASVVLFLTLVLGRPGDSSPVSLTGFHIAVAVACSLCGAGALCVAGRRVFKGRAWRFPLITTSVSALVLIALAPILISGARTSLDRLMLFSIQMVDTSESQHLFSGGILGPVFWLGGGVLGVPLVIAALVAAARKRDPRTVASLVLLLAALIPCFFQGRFARPFAGILAVVAALAVPWALRARSPRWRWIGIASAGVLALPIPTLWQGMPPPLNEHQALAPSLKYLREHTPAVTDDPDAETPPAYAVLVPWFSGHLVTTLAKRPVLASPIGFTPRAEEAARESVLIFAEPDLATANRRCRELGIRYVLAHPWPGGARKLMALAGRPGDRRTPLLFALLGKKRISRHFRLLHAGPSYVRVYEVEGESGSRVPPAHAGPATTP